MKKADCKLLGTLSKPHGYKGHMVLISENNLPEELEDWESVFVEIDGLLVPFFFDEINHSHDTSAIVKFEDYDNVDQLGDLLRKSVYAPLKMFKRKRGHKSESGDLTGFTVIDTIHGELGTIAEIVDYNHNLVFRVVKNKKEILIPAQESMIESIDLQTQTVFINAPEGLIDIYL
jgi:16S rRNA processing protein RimM